jgi:hypothetical protein
MLNLVRDIPQGGVGPLGCVAPDFLDLSHRTRLPVPKAIRQRCKCGGQGLAKTVRGIRHLPRSATTDPPQLPLQGCQTLVQFSYIHRASKRAVGSMKHVHLSKPLGSLVVGFAISDDAKSRLQRARPGASSRPAAYATHSKHGSARVTNRPGTPVPGTRSRSRNATNKTCNARDNPWTFGQNDDARSRAGMNS